MGVISRIDEHTKWCAGMVVVPKQNGQVRICVDLTKLNESVLRKNHRLPCVDHKLAQLWRAKIFSKLDANSGWQIPLSPESRTLTTFITPFGRFFFNRLPFGVSSAPEHFQRKISQVLEGCEGILCKMDDILVHAPNQPVHNERLFNVLEKLGKEGITLNPEKCVFRMRLVRFTFKIIHVPGKDLTTADTLSRAPLVPGTPENLTRKEE